MAYNCASSPPSNNYRNVRLTSLPKAFSSLSPKIFLLMIFARNAAMIAMWYEDAVVGLSKNALGRRL